MMVGSSQQEILDLGFAELGTRQQGVSVILRELMLPDRFYSVSPSFPVRGIINELSARRLTSCRLRSALRRT
ncbi:unnamed protein product [Schistosoma margrebowiei]|uniref:Uncharacterized protein n=1 Tax=Schistosoma margrebowiei TaxID=48269 RepID=A0A183MZL1_9TREM|nr:unnamed protein product [Schistosoma margrebowiei]